MIECFKERGIAASIEPAIGIESNDKVIEELSHKSYKIGTETREK